jgi:chlorite dismutase
MTHSEHTPQTRSDDANATVRYAVWAVYARNGRDVPAPRAAADELREWQRTNGDEDIELRGIYDVSGMRAEADLMLWLHGPSADGLQASLRRFRRTQAGSAATLKWSSMGTHRRAEFSADHLPSFMLGTQPLNWLCVYPFVRSYDWYLLPEEDRRTMLSEHGLAGRAYKGVQANTVAAFALNDWEWILALESNDLHELVDLMRGLRKTEARRHIRVEIPFHTGHLVDFDGAVDVLR